MQILEKILEDMLNYERVAKTDEDLDWNKAMYKCYEIICSYMDEAKNVCWIPVEERLPEDNHKEFYDMQLVTLEDGEVCMGVYNIREKEWWTRKQEGESWYTNKHNVIAWKPLPEAYERHQKIIPTRCKATYNGQIHERKVEIDMQGIIKIKNVPETCKDCQFHSYASGCMLKKRIYEGFKATRPDWCPIEVNENDEQEK